MARDAIEENQIEDVLGRIHAMRSQEEHNVCRDYLTSLVDASCRTALVDWCYTVVNALGFSRETVGIGTSIFDRYLSSGQGKSAEALRNKHQFQLAAITAFYMAVKLHEPVQLGIHELVRLCRGLYEKGAIVEMELDILHSLKWRVCMSATTPLEYVRHFMQLLPMSASTADVILENATKYAECAIANLAFSACRVSAVGIACLAGALHDTEALTSLEKESIWHQLATKVNFDIASTETRKVERQLLPKSKCREPATQKRPSLSQSTGVESIGEQPSSPISVLERTPWCKATPVCQC